MCSDYMHISSFTETQMQFIIRDYVCAYCWKPLSAEKTEDGEKYLVHCLSCGDGVGFVTKAYVDHRRTQDHFDKIEAEQILMKLNIIPNPLKDKSEDDLLKELGF